MEIGLCQFFKSILIPNNHANLISCLPHDTVGSSQDLEVTDHAAPTETVILIGQEIQEHHPGVGAGLPVADGGGGGDDTTPRVRQVLWITTSGGSQNRDNKVPTYALF